MRPLLVQPAPGERVSGGYLYNAQMAAHGVWDLLDVRGDDLRAALDTVVRPLVVADSIWLSERAIGPFVELVERGVSVAVMMHSFPSMIEVTERGEGVRTEPTPFEVEALERLGIVLAPGPHYPAMLRHAAVESIVLSPGVDEGFRRAPRARSGPLKLVSIGAVTRRKGFLDLAEQLASRCRHDDYHWTVVGDLGLDAGYAEAVRQTVRSLPNVALLGTRRPEETKILLKAADVLVMPSYDENHPLVLLEALAASVPSVAYAAGAATHILGDGKAGLVTAIGDKVALGRAVGSLIDDERLRYALAEGASELGQAIPSWPEAAAGARARLEPIVARSARPNGL